jgi:hypothetical protein
MDNNDIKARELALWHAYAEDDQAAGNIPEYQHGALRKHAEVLERLGVIDAGEQRELNELADARYASAAEAMFDRTPIGE